jgi:Na+/alanine symporter
MVEQIASANSWLNGYVWGWPMIVLLLGTGILLTVLTGAVQFRYLGFALREVLGKITQKSAEPGSVSPFQAVATALASTVGVGNIAGVATAISIGGPGSLFWLWVSGLLGMCTKFAEIVIAMHYREKDATGTMRGGAMYTLKNGMGLPWLGAIFAGLVSLAAFGIGNMVLDRLYRAVDRLELREVALQLLRPRVAEDRAGVPVRAALGDDVQHAADRLAELGRIAAGLDLGFPYEVERRRVAQ